MLWSFGEQDVMAFDGHRLRETPKPRRPRSCYGRVMRLHVRYFAAARDAAATANESIDVDDATAVGALRAVLVQRHPQLQRVLPQCRLAVDQQFVDDTSPLREGVEVAVLPPMAGG